MIIFDLDGTLADCEHRRHYVDNPNNGCESCYRDCICKKCQDRKEWKPNWELFYEACDKDEPIQPVVKTYNELRWSLGRDYIQIWSGRCESVRKKTEKWLDHYEIYFEKLKMRPIGDYTPDEELKENWLYNAMVFEAKTIDFVFDDRPKVVRMWRRNGIFVFDCNQTGKEF